MQHKIYYQSVQSLSRVPLCVTPWTAAPQASLSFPVHHQLPELADTHVHWVDDAIQPSSVVPFSSCPQSFLASRSFPMSQLFTWGCQSIGVSALASALPMNTQAGLQNGLVGSLCSPRDSQESSPTPQFKSINSLALSFLHSPTLTSIHDHWKKT